MHWHSPRGCDGGEPQARTRPLLTPSCSKVTALCGALLPNPGLPAGPCALSLLCVEGLLPRFHRLCPTTRLFSPAAVEVPAPELRCCSDAPAVPGPVPVSLTCAHSHSCPLQGCVLSPSPPWTRKEPPGVGSHRRSVLSAVGILPNGVK